MAEFVMPKLGADMSTGTLVCWRKQVGDKVHRGDIIAEVETEKGNIDVEVFSGGTIEKFLIAPGEKVPVGTVMALIREDSSPGQSAAAAADASVSQPTIVPPAPATAPRRGRRSWRATTPSDTQSSVWRFRRPLAVWPGNWASTPQQ